MHGRKVGFPINMQKKKRGEKKSSELFLDVLSEFFPTALV